MCSSTYLTSLLLKHRMHETEPGDLNISLSLFSGESSAAFGFVHPDGGREDAGHVTYHGVVAEDANEVLFNPPIRTQGELICKFEVVHHHNQAPSPFEVRDNFIIFVWFELVGFRRQFGCKRAGNGRGVLLELKSRII